MSPTAAIERDELVRRAQRGSRRSFEALWLHYGRQVRAVLTSMLRRGADEDLAQDVALAAFRGLPALADPASFGAWLRAIARNHARDAIARRARSLESPLDDAPESALVAPPTGDALAADDVACRIDELPRCHRAPLVLRLVHELSGPEIAERLGMTQGSVRVNLCRGMKLLREVLGGHR